MLEKKTNDKLDDTDFENIRTKYTGDCALEEEEVYK